MARLALTLAFAAMVAAGLHSPGAYVAIGLGIAAIGCGFVGFGRRDAGGAFRLLSAAAMTVGSIGFVLGVVRVAIALAAIDRIGRLLG